jgi:hypothetical protein
MALAHTSTCGRPRGSRVARCTSRAGHRRTRPHPGRAARRPAHRRPIAPRAHRRSRRGGRASGRPAPVALQTRPAARSASPLRVLERPAQTQAGGQRSRRHHLCETHALSSWGAASTAPSPLVALCSCFRAHCDNGGECRRAAPSDDLQARGSTARRLLLRPGVSGRVIAWRVLLRLVPCGDVVERGLGFPLRRRRRRRRFPREAGVHRRPRDTRCATGAGVGAPALPGWSNRG